VIIAHDRLEHLVHAIFAAAGCGPAECGLVARHLIEANLAGHDSHGVIRVATYIDWLRAGKVLANRDPKVVVESESFAVIDGQFGFGQVMGEAAVKLGVEMAERRGVAVVALRNTGHLGRIGAWAEQAAEAGKVSVHFVNTSGGGILVAPFGGVQRRLSANPIAAGAPVPGGAPVILDISTCTIAEGKIRVASHQGGKVPEGCILDGEGRPTDDPRAFYGPPPGAILPMGGHKGYGLSVLTEVLAGALTGGGCSHFGVDRIVNNMLSVILDPACFRPEDGFAQEVRDLIAHVKSSRAMAPDGEVLVPGEPEARTRARRRREGIGLDDTTWGQLVATAGALGVPVEATPRSPAS
jgi:uncharacterized oxidoreductase